MSLPKRFAVAFCDLYKWQSGSIVSIDAGIEDDLQETNGETVGQQDFNSFRWLLKDYPNEMISTVPVFLDNPSIKIVFSPDPQYKSKYPDDWVSSYDPDTDPVPNPNGDIGETTANAINGGTTPFSKPRWHTSTAYDLSSNPTSFSDYVPPVSFNYGKTYKGSILGTTTINYPKDSYSMKISTSAFESEVTNSNTSGVEYYPYAQTTLTYEKEAKFKVVFDGVICCWNEGVTIKGKVAYSTIELIATAIAIPAGSGYNYDGLKIETGSTYATHSEATWEVVIEQGYVPAEITIPKVDGKAVFINDFYITEVIKPA